MKQKLNWLYRKEIKPDISYFFLAAVVSLFTFLRIPSLTEPNWYGDEGIYQVIGHAIVKGRLLYRDIWDNKPPILYLYYAFVNGDLFSIKLLSIFFGIGAIIIFYLLAKVLFQKGKKAPYVATAVFAVLFGLPLLEGNIANAENFMLFPVLASLYLITKLKKDSSFVLPALSGIFLSIAFLTKIVGLFDFCAFLVILFTLRFQNKPFIDVKKHFLKNPIEFLFVLKQEVILGISFIVPICLTFLFFILNGNVSDFIQATFSQNVGYVGYGNYFLIPQGLLYLKLFALFFGVLLCVIYRKKLSAAGIVVYVWLLFSIFSAFFSGRPYTHYVLVALPSMCLLLGMAIEKGKTTFFHVIVFIALLLLLKLNFWYYTKIPSYYKNYVDFMTGNKTMNQYQSFFDHNTPRDYALAQFLKMNMKSGDQAFVLSDSGQIYYLANVLPPGRYIVAYHIEFYPNAILETKKAIDVKKPKYIVSTNDSLSKNFLTDYVPLYNLQGANIYERQY